MWPGKTKARRFSRASLSPVTVIRPAIVSRTVIDRPAVVGIRPTWIVARSVVIGSSGGRCAKRKCSGGKTQSDTWTTPSSMIVACLGGRDACGRERRDRHGGEYEFTHGIPPIVWRYNFENAKAFLYPLEILSLIRRSSSGGLTVMIFMLPPQVDGAKHISREAAERRGTIGNRQGEIGNAIRCARDP